MGAHAIARPSTRRLPRADAAAVLDRLRRLVRFLRLAERRSESLHGLSAAQLFVARSLADAPARSMGELAERTLTDQSSVSTVVARLAEQGLVTRRRARTDRRRVELVLSARGRAAIAGAPDLAQTRIVDAVVKMAAPRRRALVLALDRLIRAIGADTLAPHMLFEDEPTDRPARRRKTT
jgi:DNA-binding MarR family transcriptional regulator